MTTQIQLLRDRRVLPMLLILPFALFSATAGQLTDRSERSRLLRVLKAAEIGIVLCAAAAVAVRHRLPARRAALAS